MATITVETFTELAAAISSCADGDTIQIDNDINVDYEFPQGVSEIDLSLETAKSFTVTGAHAPEFEVGKYYEKVGTSFRPLTFKPTDPAWEDDYASYYVKLDDAYIPVQAASYKIINLRNSVNTTDWLVINGTLTFENIDFQNLILAGSDLIMLSGDAVALYVNKCRFTGSRSGESYLFNVPHSKILACVSCAFDMPWQGMGSPGTAAALAWTSLAPKFTYNESITGSFTADYCRFHEHYTGWTLPAGSTSTSLSKEYYPYSCAAFAMNGCYIYGDMTVPSSCTYSGSNVQYKIISPLNPQALCATNVQSAMNVMDVEVTSHNPRDTSDEGMNRKAIFNVSSFFGIIRETAKVNSVASPEYVDATEFGTAVTIPTGKATPTFVTNAEFENDYDLFRKGFDIVIKEEE